MAPCADIFQTKGRKHSMDPDEIDTKDFSELIDTLQKESDEAEADIRRGLQELSVDSEKALDDLFSTVDALLCTGQYATVDQLLTKTDVQNTPLQILLTLLILTIPARRYLQAFAAFKTQTVDHIYATQQPQRAARLLHGLV